MAVFTPVSSDELSELLLHYDLGRLVDHQGIASGIENTNYFVTTTAGDFVLTLFEKLSADQLPFYLGLMRHLSDHGVACARPAQTRAGALLTECNGKPAALATRLKGREVPQPTAAHCWQIGAALAQAHRAVADFPLDQPNLRGLAWWQATVPELLPLVSPEQAELLQACLAEQTTWAAEVGSRLPRGAVHADLFRDNVLFESEADAQGRPRLGGFIDFYFAGVDHFLFDLAVTVNDWCIDQSEADSGALVPALTEALLTAYQQGRPLSPAEQQAWPMALQAAALRFWISRLKDWHMPRAAALLTPKDPSHFERILRLRRDPAQAAPLPLTA